MLGADGKRQRMIKEKRMLPREEVYDGALEDILYGTTNISIAHVPASGPNLRHGQSVGGKVARRGSKRRHGKNNMS